MKSLALLFLISTIFIISLTKSTKKTVRLRYFDKEGPFIFLMKLHIGPGEANINLKYNKGDQIASQTFYKDVSIGAINQTMYPSFIIEKDCEKRRQMFFTNQKLTFRQQRHGFKGIRMQSLQKEQIWYFYLNSCQTNLQELVNDKQQIKFDLQVLNNGSQFGQNQQLLVAYIIIFIVWGIIIVRFSLPIANLLNYNMQNGVKISIYGGLGLLGASYLYRLVHIVFYNMDGNGIFFFEILYLLLKNLGQAIITTMIVSLSWGWSILHMNSNQYYIIICFLAGIVNIVCLVLSALTQQHEQLYHHYETIPGTIVLILRLCMFLLFAAGIIKSLQNTSGKIIFFIKNLGYIGGIYLLSWPVTVFVVEMSLPNYMHKQIITFIEQIIHISACTILCSMISNPQSSYLKVSLNDEDNPLRIKSYRIK